MPNPVPSTSLDSSRRVETIETLSNERWDLLVIGGGITGAGVALDAASRGLKVCLLEKADFASGTSSRSTRLIHGGLRYLKNLEFSLVRETGKERAIIKKIAPHLVWSESMLLPLVQGGTFGKAGLWLGLWFYDKLAGVSLSERRRILDLTQTLEMEPLLRKDGLKGAGLYREYRTSDARLVLAVLKTAVRESACCLNYCKVDSIVVENQVATGVVAENALSGKKMIVRAKMIVNAAGPWVGELLAGQKQKSEMELTLSKGSHVVFQKIKIPLAHPVYFDTPDHRLIFAIPDGDFVYAGTTDDNYSGDLDHPKFTKEDAGYILNAINHRFRVELKHADIVAGWAGLRPLIAQPGKATRDISRKDEIIESDSGLLSIAGGKLTGYRKMAERVVNLVAERLCRKFPELDIQSCRTEHLLLSDANFPNGMNPEQFSKRLEQDFPILKTIDFLNLVHRFGTSSEQILHRAIHIFNENQSNPELAVFQSSMEYCFQEEACCRPSDFLIRRTQEIYKGRKNLEEKLALMEKINFEWQREYSPLAPEWDEYLP